MEDETRLGQKYSCIKLGWVVEQESSLEYSMGVCVWTCEKVKLLQKAKEKPCQVTLCQAIRKLAEANLRLVSSSQS